MTAAELVAATVKLNACPCFPVTRFVLVKTGTVGRTTKVPYPSPDPLLFTAVRVTRLVPFPCGVPVIKPLLLIVRFVGSPVADQLVGLLEAVICRLKATPCVAIALVGEKDEGRGPAALVKTNVSGWVTDPPALEAVINHELLPTAVGVPVITPEVGTKLKPAGSRTAPKVIGAVPVAVLVKSKGTPTCAVARLVLVNTGATFVFVIVI